MSNFVANQILTHQALNDAFAAKLDVDGSGGINVTGNASIGGALTLSGNPTTALQAATKQYADLMLPLAGGTMTGEVRFNNNLALSFTDTSSGNNTGISTTSGNSFQLTGSTSGGGQRTIFSFPMHDATNTVTWSVPLLMRGQFTSSNSFAPSSTYTPQFLSNANALTGSVTSGNAYWNQFSIVSDAVNTTTGGSAPGGASFLAVTGNIGGAALTGNRTALTAFLNMNAATTNTGGTYFYTALGSRTQASANDGGTALTASGNLFGGNDIAELLSGATFWSSIVGREIDVSVHTGASVAQVIGLQVVQFNSSSVAGSGGFDNAFQILNGPGAGTPSGWDMLISFGGRNGIWAAKSTATLIGTTSTALGGPSYAAAYGIDLSAVTFSSGFLKSAGFLVDGSGNVTAVSVGNGSTALQVAGTGSWSANGAVATSLTGVGPTGSHTTVQEWFTVKNASGVTRYIPAF